MEHEYTDKMVTAWGPIPIYLRLNVDGIPKEVSLKRTWEPTRWNKESSRSIGLKQEVKALNEFLDVIQAKVYDVRRKFIESGIQFTSKALMDIVSGKENRGRMLLAIFKQHNDRMKALIRKDYAPGTYQRFETALKHTRSFINWKYDCDDINIYALNSEFINDLSFLVQNCSSL